MHFSRLLTVSALLFPALGLVAFGAPAGQSPSRPARSASRVGPIQDSKFKIQNAVSFRETVEPLLKAECTTCHSAVSHSSGFSLETPESLFKGGDKFGTKVIVPGKANESALVGYLRGTHSPRMPMNAKPLGEAHIRQIEAWIKQGAKVDKVKLGWPYTPPVAAKLPIVKNLAWTRNPIDRFVLAKLEAKGLKPNAPAPKIALLRRVYADLVGMPPTPQEAQTFLTDADPKAYEQLVDRLLSDPRYGERWARHWLDLVRYADSNGFENDETRPRAWRFRDYVIRSFNADKPYDRFLKEQIAGDELYPGDPDATIATGYARLGTWDALSTDHPQRWQDYLNDVTDTTGSVVLGLTVGCAKCHNHKYDRISQSDYYRMQAFFVSTKWTDTKLANVNAHEQEMRDQADAAEKLEHSLRQQHDALKERYGALIRAEKRKTAKPGADVDVDNEEIYARLTKEDKALMERLEREMHDQRDIIERAAPYLPFAEAITDKDKTAPVHHVLLRGSLLTPGQEVHPGFVAALCGGQEKDAAFAPPATSSTTGARSTLANWLASRDNPMTARVMVNRVWQHHFGRGIVGTPSDFGRNGDKPTHPELLDWLAIRFMNDGWSLKKLHRLLLLSNTYQQSTQTSAVGATIDPTNALLWRMNRIRLEGEALRDSVLAVSGRLNPTGGGPGIYPKVSDEVLSTGSTHKWGTSSEADGLRRTIYVFQRRSLALPIVEAFDGPDTTNTCPRRATTTIAPQALAMFNGEFSRGESRFLAERVVKEAGTDPNAEIIRAYQLALVRHPTPSQLALARAFLTKQMALNVKAGKGKTPMSDAQKAALADFCHVLINTNEFLYLD